MVIISVTRGYLDLRWTCIVAIRQTPRKLCLRPDECFTRRHTMVPAYLVSMKFRTSERRIFLVSEMTGISIWTTGVSLMLT